MSNQDILKDFMSFLGDFSRLSSIAEWKKIISNLTDVNDANDFLDYPRNIILVLCATFVITFIVLIYQLCIYCPDHDKHRKKNEETEQSHDSNLKNSSNTSLHAGEASIKRKTIQQQSKKRRKSRRKE